MFAVVRLRKALDAVGLAAVVPQDLEGHPADVDTRRPDGPGPQTKGPPRGASAIREVDDEDKAFRDPRLALMRKGTTSFRHPKTGEDRRGTVVGYGAKGATIVDDETGEAHRVQHGHYLHPAKTGADESSSWKATAASHLDLGPRAALAVHAIAAHAADAGHEAPTTLRRKDITFSGNRVSFAGKHVDDPVVAASMRWLVDRDVPDEDLWSFDGPDGKRAKVTEASLHAYRSKHGALPPPEEPPTPKRASSTAKKRAVVSMRGAVPMRMSGRIRRWMSIRVRPGDAEDVAWARSVFEPMQKGGQMRSLREWQERGYRCQLVTNGIALVVVLMGKGLPLPYSILVKDEMDAHVKAQRAAMQFDYKQTPDDGVYRALDIPPTKKVAAPRRASNRPSGPG